MARTPTTRVPGGRLHQSRLARKRKRARSVTTTTNRPASRPGVTNKQAAPSSTFGNPFGVVGRARDR